MESPTVSRGEFKFKYQKDPSFQALIDAGIGSELSDSGYCWAACLDMALSPFVPDKLRMQIIINAVKHERLKTGAFNHRGELFTHSVDDFVSAVNDELSNQRLSTRLRIIKDQKPEDYHQELLRGRTVIFAFGNSDFGHMMVMDSVQVEDGTYFYSAWDPFIANPEEARRHFSNFDLYGQQLYIKGAKHHPFLISVGEEEGVV